MLTQIQLIWQRNQILNLKSSNIILIPIVELSKLVEFHKLSNQEIWRKMFSVSIISIFFGVVFLAVLKKLYEVAKHYQRPNHFPPGPSQVQYENKFMLLPYVLI